MLPITTTTELAAACQRMAAHPFVTIDTEFLRETTYYPLLCVIAQGCKRVFLGNEEFYCDATSYLVASVDLPVSGQVLE